MDLGSAEMFERCRVELAAENLTSWEGETRCGQFLRAGLGVSEVRASWLAPTAKISDSCCASNVARGQKPTSISRVAHMIPCFHTLLSIS
eukprot:4798132-Amphidinium_carterae.2